MPANGLRTNIEIISKYQTVQNIGFVRAVSGRIAPPSNHLNVSRMCQRFFFFLVPTQSTKINVKTLNEVKSLRITRYFLIFNIISSRTMRVQTQKLFFSDLPRFEGYIR